LAIGSVVVGSIEWFNTPIVTLQDAAQCLIHTKSGVAYAWLAGSLGADDAVYSGELMEFACHLNRDEAMELAGKIYARIDAIAPQFERRTGTASFQDLYDLETLEPLDVHKEAVEQAREELAKLGVEPGVR
jgi:hypothetical protein